MPIDTLHDLYLRELRDLYGAEKLLVKSMPKMMDRAQLAELQRVLSHHMTEIREQVSRLEQIFELHGMKPEVKKPRILEGILREAEEDISEISHHPLRDAAIVAAVQQIKHFEIAAYGTLHAYAIHLGHGQPAALLQATLDEERELDRRLTEIALDQLKVEAARTA